MADSNIAWLSNLGTGPEPTEDKRFLRKTSIIATIGLFIKVLVYPTTPIDFM